MHPLTNHHLHCYMSLSVPSSFELVNENVVCTLCRCAGRAGRNGTSVMLYSSEEERRLTSFERSLNFRFIKAGPPSPVEVTNACGELASKRLQTVSPDLVRHFYPLAKKMIESKVLTGGVSAEVTAGLGSEGGDVGEGVGEAEGSGEAMEQLLARCLAAISNRKSITSR